MSTNTTNKRKCINIDTKVAIINAVDKPDKSNAQIKRDFEIVSGTLHIMRLYWRKEENQAARFFQVDFFKHSFCSSNKRKEKASPFELPNCWIKVKRLLKGQAFQTFQ